MTTRTTDTPRFILDSGSLAYPQAETIDDTLTGETVAIFPSYGCEPGSPYAKMQARRARYLADVLNQAPRFRIGDRVRLTRWLENAPDLYAPAGTTGTITTIERHTSNDYIGVTVDDPVTRARFAEWDGEAWIYGTPHDYASLDEAAADNLEHAPDVSTPAYTLDGDPVDILEFLDANGNDDYVWERAVALEPGQSVTFGGGAAAESTLLRIS